MKKHQELISDHYGQTNLSTHILTAFERAGKQIHSHEDTASFDEFHLKGRHATRELAKLADVQKGMMVLDLGSGVGGPARTLAAEFGCEVTGIDLVEEYCQTATMLTERVGLGHRVTFQHGDMMALPFEAHIFDVAWMEHTIMNIDDKAALFGGIARVLKQNGVLALYEICSGSVSPPYFPVPWASDPRINFLLTQDELRQILRKVGFKELHWKDVTDSLLDWFRKALASMAARSGESPPPLGLNLLMGNNKAEKEKNVFRNLKEDRISVLQGVLQIS